MNPKLPHLHMPCVTASTTFLALLGSVSSHAASILSFDSTLQISNGGAFNLSVYDGKAAYSGLASGAIGDGTLEAFQLVSNTPGTAYASKGSILSLPDGTNTSSTGTTFDNGDVWTVTDPGALTGGVPAFSSTANFGGTTLTISGDYNVSGTVDITNLSSGTIYLLVGGYDAFLKNNLTMTGTSQTNLLANNTDVTFNTTRTGLTRNMYVMSFDFDNSSQLYQQISYNFLSDSTTNDANRSRFMGVMVDAVSIPEPRAALLGGVGLLLLLRRRRR